LHIHEFEQLFYIVSGTMSIEIDGEVFEAESGSPRDLSRGRFPIEIGMPANPRHHSLAIIAGA